MLNKKSHDLLNTKWKTGTQKVRENEDVAAKHAFCQKYFTLLQLFVLFELLILFLFNFVKYMKRDERWRYGRVIKRPCKQHRKWWTMKNGKFLYHMRNSIKRENLTAQLCTQNIPIENVRMTNNKILHKNFHLGRLMKTQREREGAKEIYNIPWHIQPANQIFILFLLNKRKWSWQYDCFS